MIVVEAFGFGGRASIGAIGMSEQIPRMITKKQLMIFGKQWKVHVFVQSKNAI